MWNTDYLILREMTLSMGAMLGSTVDALSATVFAFRRILHNFYVAADSNPEVLLSLLLQNGEAGPVDASGCSYALHSSHEETWSFFHESHEACGSDDDRVSSSHK